MKVLIFGGNGQVGRALQTTLSALGHEVVALSRNDSGGDLLNFGAIAEVSSPLEMPCVLCEVSYV